MSSVVASGIMPVGESLANGTDRVWLRRTGVEKTPRRPRIIMEGPLVSDTTEVLSGAAPAPEESPIGHPAAETAPAGTAPRSANRNGGDLSKLLVSDLQRIAQELGISGTGRMRKGALVAAIQERTGGGRSTARSATKSATRGTSAGADAPRPLNQDTMEADTTVRPGIGEAAPAGGIGVSDAPANAGRSGVGGGEGPPADHAVTAVAPRQTAPADQAQPASSLVPEYGGRPPVTAPANRAPAHRTQASAGQEQSGGNQQGQDNRRERSRNRRRDDQGNGRDRRERSDGREPAAASGNRNGQNAQNSAGGNSRPDNRQDSRQDNRVSNDDDDDRNGRRGRDRFRNRNRRRGERTDGEPETVIADDDVLLPIAGILDALESYAFVRAVDY